MSNYKKKLASDLASVGEDLTSDDLLAFKDDLGLTGVSGASQAALAGRVQALEAAGPGGAGMTAAGLIDLVSNMTPLQVGALVRPIFKWQNKVIPRFESVNGQYAKGDAKSAACVIQGNVITFDKRAHVVSAADVGKQVWLSSEWLPPFDVTNMDPVANSITVSGAPPSWAVQAVLATDDTAVMRACTEWAGSHVYQPNVEDNYGHYGSAPRGGEVVLDIGYRYGVKLTPAEYAAGRRAALYMPRRAAMRGSAGPYSGQIMMLPGSAGHVIANLTDTSFSDFAVVEDVYIQMLGADFNPSTLQAIHWVVPRDGFPKVDAFSRFARIRTDRAGGDAYVFSGRGEVEFISLEAHACVGRGLVLIGQDDWRAEGGAFGGNGLTGIWIENSGPKRWTGWKSFFNGSLGQDDMRLSAGLVVTGDGPHQGHGYLEGEIQETRGACAVIETGGGRYKLECFDPFRQNPQLGADQVSGLGVIDNTANKLNKPRPAIRAAVILTGPHCCNNRLEIEISPTVAAWANIAPVNWAPQTSALHVTGYDLANGGPQANRGYVDSWQETVKPGGAIERGIEYAGHPKVTGAGATNGKNQRLTVDGVALT